MSGEIQKRPDGSIRKPSNWQDLAARADFNPLRDLIPAECRPAVTRLWLVNSHLIPSALALCATVRVYLDEQEISSRDIAGIVARLLQPEARMKHKFASDLIADLSRMVCEVAKSNEARDQCERLRDEATDFETRAKVIPGDLFQTPE